MHQSLLLLPLADAHYTFVYVDVGVSGENSDGRVFQESSLRKAVHEERLNHGQIKILGPWVEFTIPSVLTISKISYCMVADDIFHVFGE